MCLGSFNEDVYRDRQLDKFLEEDEGDFSNCCDALIDENGLCSQCEEHCITNDEHHENQMWEKADTEHERRRDERD